MGIKADTADQLLKGDVSEAFFASVVKKYKYVTIIIDEATLSTGISKRVIWSQWGSVGFIRWRDN